MYRLDKDGKIRYVEKIKSLNGFDPYVNEKDWICNHALLPPLDYSDIFNYLVLTVSYYTATQFKNFKSLEAYDRYVSGWVQELKIFQRPDCEHLSIKAKVGTAFIWA